MRTVDRYLLREALLPLAFGLCLFLVALMMQRLFDMLDLVFIRGVPVFTVGFLLLCLIPSVVAITLPMAVLLASLMSFGRLASDRELLAFKGAGLSLWRLAAPIAALGLASSLLLVLFNGTVLPAANTRYKRVFFEIVKNRATVAFRERVFVRDFDQYLLYFNRREGGAEGVMRDLFILETGLKPPRLITARRARLLVDQAGMKVKLILEEGEVDQPLDTEGQQYSRISFATYELGLDIQRALGRGSLFVKGITEMNYRDLFKAMGDAHLSPGDRRAYGAEFHQRLALAFAPLFVVFVGVPLGALARRGGGVGMVLSLAVIFCYYVLLTLAQGFAEGGSLPPWFALWLPNVFMVVAGFVAFQAAVNEARWSRWGR